MTPDQLREQRVALGCCADCGEEGATFEAVLCAVCAGKYLAQVDALLGAAVDPETASAQIRLNMIRRLARYQTCTQCPRPAFAHRFCLECRMKSAERSHRHRQRRKSPA
jgi:hypothetical protein